MMRDSFSTFHPIINFTYFIAVIVFSMFFMHPAFQGIAFISAFTYSLMIKGKSGLKFNILYMLPMLLFMAMINPAFNHAGVTILFYLKSGNPITFESIIYGISAAFMFITVILWFSCYNSVMTSDKFIYLFGRVIPALSLIFSMVLRFVPRYIEQIKVISNAQKCIGRDISQGNIIKRAKNGIKILSIMATWALENAIETADSMKSRGYGLPGRTSFSIFRFDNRDKVIFGVMIGLIGIVLVGAAMGQNTIRFFPSIKIVNITVFSVLIYISYFILCMIPVIINIQEAIKWKHIESRI
ncbi:energy-coupling factor transporter transmembrane protein EcfT [Tissierella sp. MSJ-40]|uniref:Energy-coupling factor transporter transmembrane protein EcfT n=1 Tax=Tissierella simiarum TaxID=2841534 RepID=A0ABS6E635_9FIRM|nr:energy-coupling factor transporter transmembrane component T [Tissierella simiarum]MBU5437890.1 energy-coupling factor transporter transmembrane protein EcfT [Tissierella simiarum]